MRRDGFGTESAMQNEIFVVLLSIVTFFSVGVMWSHGLVGLGEASFYEPVDPDALDHFMSGRGEITGALVALLDKEVIPAIEQMADQCECDVLNVFGHADGEPVLRAIAGRHVGGKDMSQAVRAVSDFDLQLLPFYYDGQGQIELRPTSNVELGMERAIRVAKYLEDQRDSHNRMGRIKYIKFYSAGHVFLPDGEVDAVGNFSRDPSRRRVEIYLTKSTEDAARKIVAE